MDVWAAIEFYRGTWELKDSDVNNKSSQTRIWVNTRFVLFCFVLFWRISGMMLEERTWFRILPSSLSSSFSSHNYMAYKILLAFKKIVVFLKGFISTQLHTNHFFHALYACGWCYSHGQWNHEGRKENVFLDKNTNNNKKGKEKRKDTTRHKVNPCMWPFHSCPQHFPS